MPETILDGILVVKAAVLKNVKKVGPDTPMQKDLRN
jgi:hypothetical protein